MTIFKDLKFHVSGTPNKEALSMLSVGGAKKCSYFHTLVKLNIVSEIRRWSRGWRWKKQRRYLKFACLLLYLIIPLYVL